jgi:hypothetical protein
VLAKKSSYRGEGMVTSFTCYFEHYHAGAGAKTVLAVIIAKSQCQNQFNVISSFLGLAAKKPCDPLLELSLMTHVQLLMVCELDYFLINLI